MIPGSANPLLLKSAAAAGGLQISRSLRFNSSDSGYCGRVPASASNRTTWTFSAWIKRSQLGVLQRFFSGATATNDDDWTAILFNSSDQLVIGGYNTFFRTSNSVYRDCSAWYHLVITADLGNGTNALKLRAWINNVEVTWASTSSNPSTTGINSANNHAIGAEQSPNNGGVGSYFNGYLANIHFIDGQALTPSSFTETDATTGQLIPKTYTGSYGTNGFYLEFSDNSSNTASTLGKDYSGLGNNWTPNNLSVTAGAGNDSLIDSPTNYGTDTGVGGEVRGNYCTWNAIDKGANVNLANGNLDTSQTAAGIVKGTIGTANGKWYWEYTCAASTSNAIMIGIATAQAGLSISSVGGDAYSWGYYGVNGQKYTNNAGASYGASFTTGDVIGVALDADAGTLTFYKNGASQGQAYSGLTSGPYFPAVGTTNQNGSANFGQRAFAYTAPSGFKALCTANLPAPLVTKSNTVMDVVTYTGTGAALTPTSSLGFNPDWIWIKSRSAATDHALYDVVRGAQARLESNTTDAEVTTDGGVTAFNSAGFTLGTLAQVNTSAATYVAWCWDAGTSTVSNTQGSITSQVRANATAGFSVVSYTSTGSSQTAGHGLGVASPFIIQKRRDGTGDWYVGTTLVDGSYDILVLNSTAAKSDAVGVSAPTSTVFSTAWFGTGSENWIAYCFAPVVGYSNFGSYVGNGSSTDGPFVYTGFRPRWVMIKGTDGTTTNKNWMIKDALRPSYNVTSGNLYANEAFSEDSSSTVNIDFLSNGFKIYGTYAGINTSANNYIFAAFAESPFNYARAR